MDELLQEIAEADTALAQAWEQAQEGAKYGSTGEYLHTRGVLLDAISRMRRLRGEYLFQLRSEAVASRTIPTQED